MTAERVGYKVTLGNGTEVLVRQLDDGYVIADSRGNANETWQPVEIVGGKVERVEI